MDSCTLAGVANKAAVNVLAGELSLGLAWQAAAGIDVCRQIRLVNFDIAESKASSYDTIAYWTPCSTFESVACGLC
jgi:hypothetical protein